MSKRTITLKIFITNIDKPFELTSNKNFHFDYGVGKEKWGSKLFSLQYALKMFDSEIFFQSKDFLLNLSDYLDDIEKIEKIELNIIDLENIDKNIYYTFKKHEFTDFNACFVIDSTPRFMVAFEVPS